ncbi:unnamed protein product [Miscanthus lutarioriparius]|uniref:ZF-HD dimerization-type domain-containing protein n=1 Tax=Miscanthus lutarioriparius TaxID=422564 RepID=A0A811N6A8_9POAL|nr:unnamed protein product [Miscanthus lutarioriparius]
MDFDDHDDGDEEMAPEAPPLAVAGGFGGGVAAPKPPGEPGGGRAKAPSDGLGLHGGGGRYRECLKNHAVGIGGHAVDGCGEFMPAGEEGTLDALRCAACNCHRNFHRKESPAAAKGSPISPAALVAYGATPHQHQHFSPYYRTPAGAGYFHHHHHQPLHHMAHTPRPLALPSMSPHSGRDDGDDLSAGMMAAAGPMSAVGPLTLSGMSLGGSGGAGPSGGTGGSGSGKKRFRTKFTQEQKDKMMAFAERVGWRIQKHDEAALQQFCDEVCVKRHVLKVWMHNNKHTLGKKP